MEPSFRNYRQETRIFNEKLATFDYIWGRHLSNLFLIQTFSDLSPESIILEIGPGPDGTFEELVRSGRSFSCYAYEPCQHFLPHLKQLNVKVYPTALNENSKKLFLEDSPEKADLVICSNQIYFHHDPYEFLHIIQEITKPGGLILLVVQNSSSKAKQIQQNNNIKHWFSPKSFEKFLARSEMEVIFLRTCGPDRNKVELLDERVLYPGITRRRWLIRSLKLINKLLKFNKKGIGPLLHTSVFSPAIAISRNEEFWYGGEDRYQIKALLRVI
jgi:SAM-dependent methyltransferase